jgi:UDP-2,4-diacetamido-2,4,6-trideoxy-beta-L-altropyranose hydrolase
MRCLALADALGLRGARVRFVCRHLTVHLQEMLRTRGHECVMLGNSSAQHATDGPPYINWLGTSQQIDAQDTVQALSDLSWDWLVVDHYALDASWERTLRPQVGRILVIDDLADRDHDGDLLLDQNLNSDIARRYRTHVPADCRLMLGPRYALLRPEFAQAREQLRTRDGRIRRLLVFFGGSDRDNYTGLALEALRLLGPSDIWVDVVVGTVNSRRAEIEAAARQLPNVGFHCDTPDMVGLMGAADLALGAGGSTTWERACLGLPSVVIVVAENQREPTTALGERGQIVNLDATGGLTPELLAGAIRTLAACPSWMRHLGRSGLELVDGRGAMRVARELLATPLHLRRATASDSANLHAWRNAEEVRRHSRDPSPISRADHVRWLASTLADDRCALLIAEQAGEAVGVLRYDINKNEATVSIYLVPGKTGQGHGVQILLEGDRWLARNRPAVRCLHAEVLTSNEASVRAFTEAGYEPGLFTYRKRLQA